MFASLAFAEGAAAAQPSFFQSMIPLILMILIFYFLLIRPQMKKTKEHKTMLSALQVGDRVVTNGGIHGELKAITPEIVTIALDDKVKIKVDRVAIARKTGSTESS
jgi:preprotein translocase subunit YajC